MLSIRVKDILKGKTKKAVASSLVFCEKKSNDYILSIPHGGTLIIADMIPKLRISRSMLIGTDLFTRELYNTSKGIHVVSLLNLYLVNMNRFKHPKKIKGIPIHMRSDPLHMAPLVGKTILKRDYSESEKKILMGLYERFHRLVQGSIDEMKRKRGFALIFDCHSMNSWGLKNTPDKGKERPDFLIGTLSGKSSHSGVIRTFYESLKEQTKAHNLTVEKDKAYKGGFITQKYANLSEKINILQLEIKKSIYMEEGLGFTSKKAFTQKKGQVAKINSIVSKVFDDTSKKAQQIFNKGRQDG